VGKSLNKFRQLFTYSTSHNYLCINYELFNKTVVIFVKSILVASADLTEDLQLSLDLMDSGLRQLNVSSSTTLPVVSEK